MEEKIRTYVKSVFNEVQQTLNEDQKASIVD